jgi:hypothetical protein
MSRVTTRVPRKGRNTFISVNDTRGQGSRALLTTFCVLLKLLTLLLAGNKYGYLSDELYFLDASDRLAFGYVDAPPAIMWLIALVTALFGDALWVLRTTATLLGIAVVLLAVDICRSLGGRWFAQWLTAIVVLTAPAFVSIQAILTMNVLDQLWWALSFWLLLRYIEAAEPRYMVLLGVVFGMGILTKLSILVLGLSFAASLLLWQRELYRRPETWIAALIALVVASPYLIWQIVHDWPLLEFMAAYNSATPEPMVINQPIFALFVTLHPPYAVIWIPGAIYALFSKSCVLRILGTASVLCVALFLQVGVKFYFAVPPFIVLVAAGAVFWESWLRLQRRRWLAGMLLAVMSFSGLAALPIGAPLLPPEALQRLADFVRDGEQGFPGTEPARISRYFPQFAEMHGWPELAGLTVSAYRGLGPQQKEGAVIVAAYYGQAGALNRLDDGGLPPVYSGHMSYHSWLGDVDLGKGLYVGFQRDELESVFGHVEEIARFDCPPCMAREDGLRLFFVSSPTVGNQDLAAFLKRYHHF